MKDEELARFGAAIGRELKERLSREGVLKPRPAGSPGCDACGLVSVGSGRNEKVIPLRNGLCEACR